jgi:predicted transcriptional regulator
MNEIKKLDMSLFGGMMKKTDSEKYFSETLELLLNGTNYNISQLALTNSAMCIVADNIDKLYNIIIFAINKTSVSFNTYVQQSLDDKTFSNNIFLNKYNDYIKNSIILKKSLMLLNNYFITENNKHLITIYTNYLFYINVINTRYKLNGKYLYLYEILLHYNDESNISEFLSLFKLYNYFLGFSYSLQNNTQRHLYFNTELDSIFKNTKTSSEQFIHTVMTDIDTNIKTIQAKYKKIDDNDNTFNAISKKITDYIKMCNKVCNKSYFMACYMNYMQNRLLEINNNYHSNLEKEFVKEFYFNDEPELYIKMLYCISDIKQSKLLTNCIHNDVYNDVAVFNRNICKYKLLRSYAWKESKLSKNIIDAMSLEEINLPQLLSHYTEAQKSLLGNKDKMFYESCSSRSIYVDYVGSTGVIELLTDKVYTVTANMLQIAIIDIVNKTDSITAMALSESLNIPLSKLSLCLNSLLHVKLILKESKTNGDPMMIFKINNHWTNTESDVCLVTIYENIKYKIQNKETVVKSDTLEREREREELFLTNKARVLYFMSEVKSASVSDIKKFIELENLNITNTILENILSRLVHSNTITFDNDMYYHNNTDSDNDDQDQVTETKLKTGIPSNILKHKIIELFELSDDVIKVQDIQNKFTEDHDTVVNILDNLESIGIISKLSGDTYKYLADDTD